MTEAIYQYHDGQRVVDNNNREGIARNWCRYPGRAVWNKETIDEYYEKMTGPTYPSHRKRCPTCRRWVSDPRNQYCDECGAEETAKRNNIHRR